MPESVAVQRSGRDYARELLGDEQAFATSLLVLALDQYGPEILGSAEEPAWTATTFRMQLEADFVASVLPQNLDKLMAAIAIITTNDFLQRLPRFIRICNCLAGDDFDPEQFDLATVREMAWGVTEALLLYPPDQPFTDEIRAYIRNQLKEEGFTRPPDALRLVLGSEPLPVDDDWSDDPEMYMAFLQKQQTDVDELETLTRENLLELAGQLERLPLDTGNVSRIVEKIRRVFSKQGTPA